MNNMLPFVCPNIALGPQDAVISAILEAHHDTIALAESNTSIITREFKTKHNNIYVDVRLNEASTKLSVLSVPRFLIDSGDLDVISLITAAINNDYYVSMHIDSGKIKFYSRFGMIAPHYMTIYGFDLSKGVLYCADFFSGKYSTKEISIHDFILAFRGMFEVAKHIGDEANYCRIYWRIDLYKYLSKEGGKNNAERLIRNFSDIYNGKNYYGETELYQRKWNPHFTDFEELHEAELSREQYGLNALRRLKAQHEMGTENSKYILTMRQYYSYYFFCTKILDQIKLFLSYRGENIDCALIHNMTLAIKEAERLYNLNIKYQLKKSKQYADHMTQLMGEIICGVRKSLYTILSDYGSGDLG